MREKNKEQQPVGIGGGAVQKLPVIVGDWPPEVLCWTEPFASVEPIAVLGGYLFSRIMEVEKEGENEYQHLILTSPMYKEHWKRTDHYLSLYYYLKEKFYIILPQGGAGGTQPEEQEFLRENYLSILH